MKHRINYFLITFMAISIFFSGGCEDNSDSTLERGELIENSMLAELAIPTMASLFAGYVSAEDLEYDVHLEKIVYNTVDAEGNSTPASGAVMLPDGLASAPVLVINHGTVTKRTDVASVKPLEVAEGFLGIISAAGGVIVVIPDYLGFGESTIPHPYLHAKSMATSIVDCMRGAKEYCDDQDVSWNGKLFLAGYSEGGYATLAAHREIEQFHIDEFDLTAVAPMAGPYDLKGTVDSTFSGDLAYGSPIYPAFILTAYDQAYGLDRLSDFFVSPYDQTLPGLFDGSKSYGEITAALPTDFSSLIKQSFIDNYLAGNETEINAILEENTLLDWTSTTPLRFFHGDADEVVPYFNSVTALENLGSLSTSTTELITIPGGTHGSAGFPAMLGMLEWIDGFLSASMAANF